MNGLGFKIKKFFANKNTITIFGIIIILVLLYYGYDTQVQSAVEPISIPVASVTIQPKTEITEAMITYVEVPSVSVGANVITTTKKIVGQYTNVNALIPAGSMFYNEAIVTGDELPDYAFSELEEGQIPVYYEVDVETTYGNSIYPGNLVDIYMKGEEGDKPFVGRLVENVKVLTVKDSSGLSVFENTEEDRTPASITFGVPQDIFMLLIKAKYLQNVELILVPKGGTIESPGSVTQGLDYLIQYISSQTVNIEPEDTEGSIETTE